VLEEAEFGFLLVAIGYSSMRAVFGVWRDYACAARARDACGEGALQ